MPKPRSSPIGERVDGERRIAEIRERLAKATHGQQWIAVRHLMGDWSIYDSVEDAPLMRFLQSQGEQAAMAAFIAHAPEDIAYLLSRLSSSPPEGEDTQRDDTDYSILVEAVEQSLAPCIVEDDVAAVAIYADAIEEAGTAISTADDALHTIRAALRRDLGRKHSRYLMGICTYIDGIWEGSVTFGRLREARLARDVTPSAIDSARAARD